MNGENTSAAPTGPQDDEQRQSDEEQARQERYYVQVRDALVPTLMAFAISFGGERFNPVVVRGFRDQLLAEAGAPQDPVEKMLLEQLAVAHLRILELHTSAGRSKEAEFIAIYNAAAVKLLGEMRRTAEALKKYRTPVNGRSTTIIHRVEQANIANGGDQDVSYVDAGAEGGSQMVCRDEELGSNNGAGRRFDHGEAYSKRQESAARVGRPS